MRLFPLNEAPAQMSLSNPHGAIAVHAYVFVTHHEPARHHRAGSSPRHKLGWNLRSPCLTGILPARLSGSVSSKNVRENALVLRLEGTT